MSESPTEHFEHAEHAEHVAHSGDPFLARVSVTIAILAVLAASVGSLETIETAATISAKNEAVFFQNKETDAWNFFQAKSVKKNMYEIAAASNAGKADDYLREAKRYDSESKDVQKEATDLERRKDGKLVESELHEQRHHVLTIGVTLLHVSIAIATISIIMRGRRWPWYTSLALGAGGLAISAFAYLGGAAAHH
jgi:hypothetical protein